MNESIGARLRLLRGTMTQPEFAKIAGTSKQHVSRIESGLIREPSPAWLERWARHFGVRMEWLTTGQGPREAAAQAASQPAGLDLDILRVALIALREAAEAEDKEIDLYESAPIIAYAYRERAAMREAPTKAQLREFDESIRQKLRGDEGDGGWRGRAAEAGQGGNAKDAAQAAENGARAARRKRRVAGAGG